MLAYRNQQQTKQQVIKKSNLSDCVMYMLYMCSNWPFNINVTRWLSCKGINIIQDNIISIPDDDPKFIAEEKVRER